MRFSRPREYQVCVHFGSVVFFSARLVGIREWGKGSKIVLVDFRSSALGELLDKGYGYLPLPPPQRYWLRVGNQSGGGKGLLRCYC